MSSSLPPAPESAGESFAERLRRLRLARGLSQRQLAKAGVSYAYVSRLESGDRRPSVRAIRVLARRLGVTPEYLETGIDVPRAEEIELRLNDAELRLRLDDGGAEAERSLARVLADAEAAAEHELAVRARVALGLAAFHGGRHAEAVDHLAAAAESPSTTPASQPNVYLALASSHLFLGRPHVAIGLLEQALADLDGEPSDPGVRIRFASYLSGALGQLGEFDRAREVLREAAGPVDGLDQTSRVRLVWSRALLAARQGRPRTAVREMRLAILLLDQTEDSLELARAHLFCAEVALWAGELALAASHLPAAARLRSLPAESRDLGVLASCEALLHARRGEHELARERAAVALDALREAPSEQGIAWTALAVSAAASGDVDLAGETFANGVDALSQAEEYRQALAVCGEWRSVLESAGRHVDAAQVAELDAQLAERAARERNGGVRLD